MAIALAAVILVAGCTTTPQPKEAQPPDVSGVDVPSLLMQRFQRVKPVDATNDGLFSAHLKNEGIDEKKDFQFDVVAELMRLSHESGRKITLHGASNE
jgi:hypothetical protein